MWTCEVSIVKMRSRNQSLLKSCLIWSLFIHSPEFRGYLTITSIWRRNLQDCVNIWTSYCTWYVILLCDLICSCKEWVITVLIKLCSNSQGWDMTVIVKLINATPFLRISRCCWRRNSCHWIWHWGFWHIDVELSTRQARLRFGLSNMLQIGTRQMFFLILLSFCAYKLVP